MYGIRTFAVSVTHDGDGTAVLELAPDERGPHGAVPLHEALDALEQRGAELTGVIVTGDRGAFAEAAAGDGAEDGSGAAALLSRVETAKAALRRLERLPVPVVSAIDGSALGPGLELALATHHRIALRSPDAVAGFTGLQVGLTPGMGGVVRTVRLLGIQKALSDVLLTGAALGLSAVRTAGLVDEVVDSATDLLPAARTWIAAQDEPAQAWDRDGYRMPGGTLDSPRVTAALGILPSQLRQRLGGADYLAAKLVMSAAIEGAQVDPDTALRVESRHFVRAATSMQHRVLADLWAARDAVLARYSSGGDGLRAPGAAEGDDPAGPPAFGGSPAFEARFAEGVRLSGTVLDAIVPGLVAAYVLEAVTVLDEGTPPALVERASRMAGFRTPPLELADRVGLDAILDLPEVKAAPGPAAEVLRTLADSGRTGRAAGGGFYDYPESEPPRVREQPAGTPPAEPVSAADQMAGRLDNAVRAAARTAVSDRAVPAEDVDVAAVIALGYPPRLGRATLPGDSNGSTITTPDKERGRS